MTTIKTMIENKKNADSFGYSCKEMAEALNKLSFDSCISIKEMPSVEEVKEKMLKDENL